MKAYLTRELLAEQYTNEFEKPQTLNSGKIYKYGLGQALDCTDENCTQVTGSGHGGAAGFYCKINRKDNTWFVLGRDNLAESGQSCVTCTQVYLSCI